MAISSLSYISCVSSLIQHYREVSIVLVFPFSSHQSFHHSRNVASIFKSCDSSLKKLSILKDFTHTHGRITQFIPQLRNYYLIYGHIYSGAYVLTRFPSIYINHYRLFNQATATILSNNIIFRSKHIDNTINSHRQVDNCSEAERTKISIETDQNIMASDSSKSHSTESNNTAVNGFHHNGTTGKNDLTPKEIRIPVPFGHVAAQAWGNPDAKTKILALHGWLDNSGSFEKLIPLLINTEDYYIVAYDDIGVGLSSHVPDGMHYDRTLLLITLRRVVKYLSWEKYILMGHSLGSITSFSYASIYTSEVERIISIDNIVPPLFKQRSWQGKARLFIEENVNRSADKNTYSYDSALKRIIEGHMKSLSLEDAQIMIKRGASNKGSDENQIYVFNRDVRFRTLFLEFLTGKQYLEIYKNLKCHLLILRAAMVDHQQWGDVGSFYAVFKEVTASFKEEIISGTHHIHMGNPKDCSDAIKKWMKQCDQRDKIVEKK